MRPRAQWRGNYPTFPPIFGSSDNIIAQPYHTMTVSSEPDPPAAYWTTPANLTSADIIEAPTHPSRNRPHADFKKILPSVTPTDGTSNKNTLENPFDNIEDVHEEHISIATTVLSGDDYDTLSSNPATTSQLLPPKISREPDYELLFTLSLLVAHAASRFQRPGSATTNPWHVYAQLQEKIERQIRERDH